MGPQYLDLMNETVTEKYGDASFDVKKPYYTHQTPFLQAAVRAGNSCVVHRLPGEGMTDVANKVLYLDVLAGPQPLYEKNEDGSLKFDASGNPMIGLIGAAPTPIDGACGSSDGGNNGNADRSSPAWGRWKSAAPA
jgi:hypothetical protein